MLGIKNNNNNLESKEKWKSWFYYFNYHIKVVQNWQEIDKSENFMLMCGMQSIGQNQ